jgi:hypothetical protein
LNFIKPLLLSVILFCHLAIILHAQPLTSKDHGLKEFNIKDPKLGLIQFYVNVENLQKKEPLFIDVNGSGGLPLCIYIKGKGFGEVSFTYNDAIMNAVKKSYHYVILGKPGTPFCDSITTGQDSKHANPHALIANYKFSKEYNRRLSLGWRVNATKKVITYLIDHGYWDGTQIVAHGYSEGAQVVPSLAVADKRITHVVAVVGSGLNQFYDYIVTWRIKAAKGEITQQQAQDSINAELAKIKDIYRHPNDTRLQYRGHSYKRWASFGQNPPFELLRTLKIPIYMIVATADDNSPVYGLDYVQLDFIRLGKSNLTYDTCIGCDHFLNSTDDGKTINHDYIPKMLKWLGRQ